VSKKYNYVSAISCCSGVGKLVVAVSGLVTNKAERHGRVVTHLLRIREVPGSSLRPETGYSDGSFRGFPQSLQANARIVP
jgi:hypothetical protein